MGILELDSANIVDAIDRWRPGPFFTEQRYQASLARFLQGEYPRSRFLLEHAVGRGRADIFACMCGRTKGANVIIELKYELLARNEYLRLVGQLHEYVDSSSAEIVVVLCGATKQEWRSQLQSHLNKLVADRWFYKAFVVAKAIKHRDRDGRFLPSQLVL